MTRYICFICKIEDFFLVKWRLLPFQDPPKSTQLIQICDYCYHELISIAGLLCPGFKNPYARK